MPKDDSSLSDIQTSLDELANSAPSPQTLTAGCLPRELLLDIMRGNEWCLSTPEVKQHLQTCDQCRELVDYAHQQQQDYRHNKEEFLSLIQGTRSRRLTNRWAFRAFNPLRFALKPNMSWAGIAIVAVLLASIPFVFAPSHEDPAMVDVLRRLRIEDVGSAQKVANNLKAETLRGVHRQPAEFRAVQKEIDQKRDLVGDAALKQRWTDASNTVIAAELVNRYEAGATASGSPDLVQNLQVTDATVQDNNAELQIERQPQNQEEFKFVVKTAMDQVGIQDVNVRGPNGFRMHIH